MAKKKTAGTDTTAAPAASPTTPPRPRRAPAKRVSADDRPSRIEAAGPATAPAAAGPTHDQIAEAAYHRYLSRGGGHGADFDDWIEAERALRNGR